MLKLLLLLFITGITYNDSPLDKMTNQDQETGTIIIQLDDLKNQDGVILISLYADEKGFPDEWEIAFRSEIVPITSDSMEITLDEIPHGTYGLAVVHDENENMKLDTNFLGIPREGYGFSNNARGRFGPPSFADVLFTLDSDTSVHQIKLNY